MLPHQDDPDDYDGSEDDGEVRQPYGRRFGEGQPINRRGRPKGSPNAADIARRVANRRVKITTNGRVQRETMLQLVLMAIRKEAAEGCLQAFKLQADLSDRNSPEPTRQWGVLIISETPTQSEFDKMCERLRERNDAWDAERNAKP